MAAQPSFSGSVPDHYERYLGPVIFEPYADDLVARLEPRDGLRVLEVACGTGIVTRRLCAALPGTATIVASDLNEPMLEQARVRAACCEIEWRQADAQELPFRDESFDVYVCQFGLMFLPDKVQGLREARRVLARGGLLLANVWLSGAENGHVPVLQSLLDRLYPDDTPTFLDVPHGYHDADRIRDDLAAAGWEDATLDVVRLRATSRSAHDFALGWASGSPLSHQLLERGADTQEFARLLAAELAAAGGDEPYAVEIGAIVISAARA